MIFIATLFILVLSIIFILYNSLKKSSKPKLPPGPKPWPIIGNIHLLGSKPHRSVTKLSKTYGPVMRLELGSITTIVISSPDIAKEMFLKHDLTFSSKQTPDGLRMDNHDKFAIALLPVCPKWRDLRKILTIQLFTNQRLDASQELRKKKVSEFMEYVKGCSEKGVALDIGKGAFTTTLNLLSNTFFSVDLCSYGSTVSGEFKDLFCRMAEEAGKPNLSDFFPMLRPFDLQGVRRRQTVYFRKLMEVFGKIIDERLRDEMSPKDDVLATVLNLVKNNELTIEEFKHLLVDLFIAGTDTTSSTLEWAMTELLRDPEKMRKAQTEIDQVVGEVSLSSIQEHDIIRIPYIKAILKEIWRLHPPVPFLVPHKATKDVQLCGHNIPKNANVWINLWSMGQDPNSWSNPKLFEPERFLESEIDVIGRDFNLIPFGAGRRICPAMPLAQRMINLVLVSLVHSFNWKLENGMNPQDIDMDDKFGLSLQKVIPFQAIPLPRGP